MAQKPTTKSTDSQAPIITTCGGSDVNAYMDIPSVVSAQTPKEINQLALLYDTDATLPNKSNHAPFLLEAHPDFGAHMKAFMYNVWENLGVTIAINSVYRTPAHQARLLREYNANPKGKAKPGTTSYHLYGMAMDFNPTLKDGTLLGKSSERYGKNSFAKAWIDSGIVAAGERVNLYWGGRFSKNYDPIHFDFRNVAGSTRTTLPAAVKAQNMSAAPNRIKLA